MIVNLRNDEHHHKSRCGDQSLPDKIIQIIAEIGIRLICTRTVKHYQTETHQKYNHQKQIIIKIFLILRFSGSTGVPSRGCGCGVRSTSVFCQSSAGMHCTLPGSLPQASAVYQTACSVRSSVPPGASAVYLRTQCFSSSCSSVHAG